ncbi:MAG: L-threonylcarbamoyladenylate synthase [Patescibacteria group bacterium]
MERISEDDPGVLKRAAEVLSAGGVVVVPTDTVYGLACDAFNASAVEKLFLIKKRDRGKAIPIFVHDRMLLDQVVLLDEPVATILFNFWPGALTAVILARSIFPEALQAGTPTVGVRIPNNSFILGLIGRMGRPLAVTSANKSGHGESTHIVRVVNEFHEGAGPDLIIDAGDLAENKPSIVVDCTKTPPVILREGGISKSDFFAVASQYFKPNNY